MTTPDKFFKPGICINDGNVKTFRNLYRTLSKVANFDNHEINKESLFNAARQLKIEVDSTDHEEILAVSVQSEDEEQAHWDIEIRLSSTAQQLPSVEQQVNHKVPVVILQEVKCVLVIKRRSNDINDFLRTFLLQRIETSNDQLEELENNTIFLLYPDTLLTLFIHERMKFLGTIQQSEIACLRLVEPFQSIDEFGTFSFDYLRNLFEIQLHSHIEKNFPSCWTLANDARIHCQIMYSGTRNTDGTTICGMPDRPRTDTLEQFVEDVCAKERNGKAEKWLGFLKDDDIRTFADLSNLKQTEWDNIRKLSMNGKRILKMAVDRERESVADDRRRIFEENSPNEVLSRGMCILRLNLIVTLFFYLEDTIDESRAELLANLHLIKLFMYHTLRFERALKTQGALPKLEKDCIKLSFAEMRKEGYADDGLFPKMEEFFLPLTISEQELKTSRSNVNKLIRQSQLEGHEQEADRLKKLLDEAAMHRWDVDEKITDLTQTRDRTYMTYVDERSEAIINLTPREQTIKLQRLDQEWEENQQQFEAQLLSLNDSLNLWMSRMTDYEKKLDEYSNKISNIQNELSQPDKPIDKGLVKPARGFIMYGPPGRALKTCSTCTNSFFVLFQEQVNQKL